MLIHKLCLTADITHSLPPQTLTLTLTLTQIQTLIQTQTQTQALTQTITLTLTLTITQTLTPTCHYYLLSPQSHIACLPHITHSLIYVTPAFSVRSPAPSALCGRVVGSPRVTSQPAGDSQDLQHSAATCWSLS